MKTWDWALAGVSQWIEHQPMKQKVTCSTPNQGTCLSCGPGPQLKAHERQPHIDVSLPLFLPPCPSVERKRERNGERGGSKGRKKERKRKKAWGWERTESSYQTKYSTAGAQCEMAEYWEMSQGLGMCWGIQIIQEAWRDNEGIKYVSNDQFNVLDILLCLFCKNISTHKNIYRLMTNSNDLEFKLHIERTFFVKSLVSEGQI